MGRIRLPLRSIILVAMVTAATATIPARIALPEDRQRRFMAGVELVTADFVAVDANGQPVTDLTAADVSIRIDGRNRTVHSLQFVPMARPGGESGFAPAVPPPFGSNALADAGRAFVLAVDDESFRPGGEQPMRQAVGEFLKGLSANDRVALVTVPHGAMQSDLTADRDRITSALMTVVGRAPQRLNASDEACRSRRTLEALEGLLTGLREARSPTTVLFFSSSLLGPRRDALVNAPPGACEVKREDFERVGESASAARVQFYVVMPTEVLPDPIYEAANLNAASGSANPMEGLEHLQGVTGGHRLTLATSQERPLDRILRETSGHYLLSFEPEPSDRNGEHHGMEISVNRPGVTLRSRPSVAIAEAAPDNAMPTLTPMDMLREATVYRDLPVRTTAYTSRGPTAGELQIIAVAEAIEPTAALAAASVGLYDAQGRLTAQWTAEPADLGRRAVMAALSAPPGTYRLRAAAVDESGRTGTADTEVRVELTEAGGLQLSSIVLGVSRPDTAGASFQPTLEFTDQPVATALVEIYGGQQGVRVAALVELARTVDGEPVLKLPLAIQPTSQADRFQGIGAVPIGNLQPGDYVVRVIVGLEGQAGGQVVRTIRKSAG